MASLGASRTLSAIAIVLSLVATGVSAYFAHLQVRTDVLPTLVFVYSPADSAWALRNVGNGPALDPIVAHQNHGETKWIYPTRIYPVEDGERVKLPWVGANPDKIVAYYRDAYGNHYISKVDEDRTTISYGEAKVLWDASHEKRIWER